MRLLNPFLDLHKQSSLIRESAAQTIVLCDGFLKKPRDYTIADETIMSSGVEYCAFSDALEKKIAAFPLSAAKKALTTMGIIHNITEAQRFFQQLKPEAAPIIGKQIEMGAELFDKTGRYVDEVIQLHKLKEARDPRLVQSCDIAKELEKPLNAVLTIEEQARRTPPQSYAHRVKEPNAYEKLCRFIADAQLDYVSTVSVADDEIINFADNILKQQISTRQAVEVGYVREKESSISAHFVRQSRGLARTVIDTETGLIKMLSGIFEMAQNGQGDILPGPFKARTYMPVPIVSTYAKLTA